MPTQTVSVKLTADVVYVAGTVNGVQLTWQLAHDNVWETVVQRSTNGLYDVHITCYDELGQSTQFFTVLSFGFPYLITDRTAADVSFETFKGKYDYEDFNRVGAAMQWLKDELQRFGYFPDINPRADWTSDEEPILEDYNEYLRQLRVLRNILHPVIYPEEVPDTIRYLTWREANDLETILVNLYYRLQRIERSWYYSGDLFLGEV